MQSDEPSSAPGQIVSLDDALAHLVHELEQHWAKSGSAAGQWGRFQLLRELGRGGNGIVFLAFDPAPGRQVALKVPRWPAPDRETHERFLQEAKAAGQIDHPHVLPIYECGQVGPVWYLAMPYCAGPTLADWIKAQAKPVDPRQAAQLLLTLAEAMQAVHAGGIWHRDLKPSNVLLFPTVAAGSTAEASAEPDGGATGSLADFVPRIADFGLAKLHEADRTATRTGAALGTPAYMAPEQAEGRLKDVGPATDVYALGVILYELLAGHPPFHGVADLQMFQRVVSEEPSSLRSLRREVPRDLETICLKCLAKQPARRYPKPGELADDLRRFLEGRPIQARRRTPAERIVKWVRRRQTGVLAALCVAALSGVVALLVREPAALDPGSPDSQNAAFNEVHWFARNAKYSRSIADAWRLRNENEFADLSGLLSESIQDPGQRDVRSFEWHYLQRHARLPGNNKWVQAVALSPDGKHCVSGTAGDPLIAWDLRSGKPTGSFELGRESVHLLQFCDAGRRLAVVATDLVGKRHRVTIRIYDFASRRALFEKVFEWDGMYAISADGKWLAAGYGPQRRHHDKLEVWNVETGARRELPSGEDRGVFAVRFSPDGKLLAASTWLKGAQSASAEVTLWEVETARKLRTYPWTNDTLVVALDFSPDGRRLALCGHQGHGVIWDWKGDSETATFREQRGITQVAFAPGETLIVSVGIPEDPPPRRIRVRSATNGALLRDITPGGFSVGPQLPFALTPDGNKIAYSGDVDVHVYDLDLDRDWTAPAPKGGGEAWCVAFSPSKEMAVGYDHEAGGGAETFKLWDCKTRSAKALPGHAATVMALAYSPDGATLATGSYDARIGLWNAADGKHLGWLEEHTQPVRAVAFSPDGRLLASGGSDHTIALWDVAKQQIIRQWSAHTQPIRALAFAPDGTRLASASNDETFALWDAATGERLASFHEEHNVACLAFSPDGTRLATGNQRNLVKLWDPSRGLLIRTLTGHTGRLRAVAFSPNGQTLATGGEDKAVRLWNVVTGDELFALPTDDFINGLAFDRGGKTLAAALHDGTVKIWSAER